MTNLVFLHGVGGGRGAWDPQVEYFVAKGYRCLAWNQPGYGDAPTVEPYDLAHVTQALAALIAPLGPVVLVGHSMGGCVAQEAYARFPERVRGLVLAFTSASFGGGSAEFARKFTEERIRPLEEGQTMAEIAARLMPTMRGSRSGPVGVETARRLMAQVPPDTYRSAVRMLSTFDRRADLPRIAVPTLLVAGGEDRTAPPGVMSRMARSIPGSEFVLIEGCGHLGPMDQPETFNEVLEEFLLRRLGGPT